MQQFISNKYYILQAKFGNSIKWQFRTNKGTNSCGLSEDIIIEFASRWKEKWVHFPSIKVTRVDGSKIIVLFVCVCDSMPSIQLLNHLIRFHRTQYECYDTGGHPSYILILYYQQNNIADTQTYNEWATQAPLLKDPEIMQANRP